MRHLRFTIAAAVLFAASLAGGAASSRQPRIVTLMPAFADDLVAMGAGSDLVGVSEYTDAPQTARLPRVDDVHGVDAERIVALHPDVVVGIPAQARLVAPVKRAGIRVVLLKDDGLSDIFADIRALGTLAHRDAAARLLADRLRAQTAQLRARVPQRASPPSVFFALGAGPIWTAGPSSFIGSLIQLAGGRDAASDLHVPWGEYSAEALLRAQPDAIVAGPETNLRAVLDREPWRSLRAVREGHVFVVSDPRIDDALYKPGPDYNEGLRWLIERLSSLSTRTTPRVRSSPS
jgi:iron complex transport system substrate-binding protein